ncbi:GGDEF and EAL domain-containing protein [Shinella sedimenti]|uniref:Diguanylate cyclase n=1 Tax=Shinella sedimenti TaxID=2919913 RepID=A0ABT0CT51_9HYPH|nr:GGDEF and EAL domain-containing protein [Shinella sedimenti]MCJ8151776.1 diguanylate cyclase [Shinella sedimenti]
MDRVSESSGAPSADVMLNLLPGMVCYLSPDLRFLAANKTYAEWRGTTLEALVGKSVDEVVSRPNLDILRHHLEAALEGETVSFAYDLLNTHQRRHVKVTYVPHKDGNGDVRGILTMTTDLSDQQDLKTRASESQALFDNAFEHAPIGMAIVDPAGILRRVNRSLGRILGYNAVRLLGTNFRSITHPDDIDADVALFEQVLAGKRNGYKIDKRYITAKGTTVETVLSVIAMRDGAGDIIRFVSQVEDVSDQREASRQLAQTNAQLAMAIDALEGGFWHMDIPKQHFETSTKLARFIDGSGARPLGEEEYLAKINPEDREKADLSAIVAGERDRFSVEYRLQTSHGERWMRCDRHLQRDAEGRPAQIIGVAIDITDERERVARWEREADTDSLTGLLNRRGMQREMGRDHAQASLGVLAIDLDGFKRVNDTLGHAAGDTVLIETARRIRSVIREGDIVARLGGDEFIVLLIGTDRRFLGSVAGRIVEAVREPFFELVQDQNVPVRASVGAAWSKTWPSDPSVMFQKADAVLYAAKAAGKDTWRMAR